MRGQGRVITRQEDKYVENDNTAAISIRKKYVFLIVKGRKVMFVHKKTQKTADA